MKNLSSEYHCVSLQSGFDNIDGVGEEGADRRGKRRACDDLQGLFLALHE